MNGIAGIGATVYGLIIQTLSAICYLFAIYLVVDILKGSLNMAWSTEIIFWLVQLVGVVWFFSRTKWQSQTILS